MQSPKDTVANAGQLMDTTGPKTGTRMAQRMGHEWQDLARIGMVSITAAPRKAGAPDPLALRANPATVPWG